MPWLCPCCGLSITVTGDETLSYGRKYGICPEHGRQKCVPSGGEIKGRMFEYPYVELWDEPLEYNNPNLVSG